MLHGVVEQVDQGPAQVGDLDSHQGIAADLNPYLGILENEIQVFQSRGHFISQRSGRQFGGLAALVGAGQEQHVVDDRAQSLELFKVRLQHLEIMLCRAPARQGDLGLADQVGQRRAQFMGDIGVERFQPRVGLFDPLQRGVERVDELIQFRRQRRQSQAPRAQRRGQPLGFMGQFDQRFEPDPCHPIPQRGSHQHADNRQCNQGDQQLMLRLVKGLGVDADHEAQRRALVLGRELADQHFQRVGLIRQLHVAHAQRPFGKSADLRRRVAVFIARIAADDPETDALVFFAEQLELVVDLHPMLGRAVTADGGFEHAVTRVQFRFGQQAKPLVDLLVERPTDQQKHQKRHQREHPAQAQRNRVTGHHGSPAHNPCPGSCAAISLRTARRAWPAGV
ncbi:hypothetical protein D3C72_1332840 [compost metagenome]